MAGTNERRLTKASAQEPLAVLHFILVPITSQHSLGLPEHPLALLERPREFFVTIHGI